MKRMIIICLLFCLANTKSFGQDVPFSPLKMTIKVDTAYPYRGLQFERQVAFIRMFYHETVYRIKVTLHNSGKKKIYFWMMSCSTPDNLLIENGQVNFLFERCYANFPVCYQLKEGESNVFYVDLIKPCDFITNKDLMVKISPDQTRLGLILINDIHDGTVTMDSYLKMKNKSKQTKIVWSNIINL